MVESGDRGENSRVVPRDIAVTEAIQPKFPVLARSEAMLHPEMVRVAGGAPRRAIDTSMSQSGFRCILRERCD